MKLSRFGSHENEKFPFHIAILQSVIPILDFKVIEKMKTVIWPAVMFESFWNNLAVVIFLITINEKIRKFKNPKIICPYHFVFLCYIILRYVHNSHHTATLRMLVQTTMLAEILNDLRSQSLGTNLLACMLRKSPLMSFVPYFYYYIKLFVVANNIVACDFNVILLYYYYVRRIRV